MMEMFDGVRVYWDGKVLRSHEFKKQIDVPKDIIFPSTPFEGELWYEQGKVNRDCIVYPCPLR
jgi:hypothetical protein